MRCVIPPPRPRREVLLGKAAHVIFHVPNMPRGSPGSSEPLYLVWINSPEKKRQLGSSQGDVDDVDDVVDISDNRDRFVLLKLKNSRLLFQTKPSVLFRMLITKIMHGRAPCCVELT